LNPKIKGIIEFFAISGYHSQWLEIEQDNQHIKFSALNIDFSNPSTDPLDSKRPAHKGVKKSTSKNGYFTAIGSSSVKTVADKLRHAA